MNFPPKYIFHFQEIDLSSVEADSSEGATTVVVTYDECDDVMNMDVSENPVEVNFEPS